MIAKLTWAESPAEQKKRVIVPKLNAWEKKRNTPMQQVELLKAKYIIAKTDAERNGQLKYPKPGAKGKKDKIVPLRILRKRAWNAFSKKIRIEEGKCYSCGKVDNWKRLDAGHFIHKNSLDFVREAIHAQCTTCNRWKHGNLAIYCQRLVEQYGPGILSKLLAMSKQVKRYTRAELEAVCRNQNP